MCVCELAAEGKRLELTDEDTGLTLDRRHMPHTHGTDVFTRALTHAVKGNNISNLNDAEPLSDSLEAQNNAAICCSQMSVICVNLFSSCRFVGRFWSFVL